MVQDQYFEKTFSCRVSPVQCVWWGFSHLKLLQTIMNLPITSPHQKTGRLSRINFYTVNLKRQILFFYFFIGYMYGLKLCGLQLGFVLFLLKKWRRVGNAARNWRPENCPQRCPEDYWRQCWGTIRKNIKWYSMSYSLPIIVIFNVDTVSYKFVFLFFININK